MGKAVMEFESGRKLRAFLAKKFGKGTLKSLGVKITSYNVLGIYNIEFSKVAGGMAGWGNTSYILKEGVKLSDKEKELLNFVNNTLFRIKGV